MPVVSSVGRWRKASRPFAEFQDALRDAEVTVARDGGDAARHTVTYDSPEEGTLELVAAAGEPAELAFNGIHVISPELLPRMTETGAFSILKTYLRLAGEGEAIQAFRTEGYWRDAGKIEQLAQIAQEQQHSLAG